MFGMYGGEEKTVKLRVKSDLVGVIIDRFGKDIIIIPEVISQGEESEYFTVNVEVAVSNQFIGWVAGLGNQVEVVSPADVRTHIKEYLANIYHVYNDK